MLADPECYDDLLLLGMWLARATILNDPEPSDTGWSLETAAKALYRPDRKYGASALATVLRQDVPRYSILAESDHRHGGACGAPMIRRSGACGKYAITAGT